MLPGLARYYSLPAVFLRAFLTFPMGAGDRSVLLHGHGVGNATVVLYDSGERNCTVHTARPDHVWHRPAWRLFCPLNSALVVYFLVHMYRYDLLDRQQLEVLSCLQSTCGELRCCRTENCEILCAVLPRRRPVKQYLTVYPTHSTTCILRAENQMLGRSVLHIAVVLRTHALLSFLCLVRRLALKGCVFVLLESTSRRKNGEETRGVTYYTFHLFLQIFVPSK